MPFVCHQTRPTQLLQRSVPLWCIPMSHFTPSLRMTLADMLMTLIFLKLDLIDGYIFADRVCLPPFSLACGDLQKSIAVAKIAQKIYYAGWSSNLSPTKRATFYLWLTHTSVLIQAHGPYKQTLTNKSIKQHALEIISQAKKAKK